MKLYIYPIAIIAIFFTGWYAKDAQISKEVVNAVQKAEQRFQAERARSGKERTSLEKRLAQDRQISEQRLGKALAENHQLREAIAAPVPRELLIFASLCLETDLCTLPAEPRHDTTSTAPQRPVVQEDIYRLLRDLDEAIVKHNLGIEQFRKQIKHCQ